MNNEIKKTLFLKIIDREIPAEIVYENEYLIVIKDIHPQAAIHLLIIPKIPFYNISFISEDKFIYLEKMFLAIQYLSKTVPGATEYKLIINNGPSAGQCINHLHMHFLAGF